MHVNNLMEANVRENAETAAADNTDASRPRVLCIDNRASRNLAVFLLRRARYDVTTAASIFDAIDLSRANSFDLFLVNHKLPLSADLYDELKEVAPNTPILLYSTVVYPFQRRRIVTTIRGRKMVPITVTEVASAVARTLERGPGPEHEAAAPSRDANTGLSARAKILFGAAGIGAGLLVLTALVRSRRVSQSSHAS
jgi:CheY-like chemotaxis protein